MACCDYPSASNQWKTCSATCKLASPERGDNPMRALRRIVSGAALILTMAAATAQQPQREWTTAEDHQQMMTQLGITALRPGPSGNENAPNQANYDEALANPFPVLPDVLTLENGRKVADARQWWRQRRPQIIEAFEREVVGRVPAKAPKITWKVTESRAAEVGGQPVLARRLVGHADNRGLPAIEVNIQMVLVTPKNAKRVPVMILFGRAAMPGEPAPQGAFVPPPPPPGSDLPATEQLIRSGWGYAYLNPTSIQADNGAGLTRGIIGLANKGQPRRPDDWGALRAWGWGASRALDYLEGDRTIDAKRVGIEGVSRYGKAALVAMAFDTRFAVALIGSSGEGGAKLHRRNFGEAVENLTGSGEYHWMAGNFLKYGAAQSSFGSRNAGDIPVDAHMLLALCAPRATFVSYGIPEKGDAKWLDQQGSFMAAIAAQPVFRLLGAKDLGRSDDYRAEKMPPVNQGLLSGRLAWRQHDGGHTDGPNWKYFIPWASGQLGLPVKGVPRQDANSMLAHQQLLQKTRAGRIDVYLLGDSITRRWGATDYPQFMPHWYATFRGWNAANFGWGGDKVENILWRVENGEMEGIDPRVVVLMAGTNDVGNQLPSDGVEVAALRISTGIATLVEEVRARAPRATLILMGILPREDNPAVMPVIRAINRRIERLADGMQVRYLDISPQLLDPRGRLREGMMGDGLHLVQPGYQVWADALAPVLTELLGPRKSEDFAPPPTGSPDAARR
jgi:lysophospholipase L1-like esterase